MLVVVGLEDHVAADEVCDEENAYYGSKPFDGEESGRITREDAASANHGDLTFDIKPMTAPDTMTIPDAVPTESSPHSEWFFRDESTGDVPGVGRARVHAKCRS
ncbi:MAG: hypothetical protein ABEK29_07555 [Bradymonadaceae bacterium]